MTTHGKNQTTGLGREMLPEELVFSAAGPPTSQPIFLLLDKLPYPTFVLQDELVLYANKAAETLIGHTLAELGRSGWRGVWNTPPQWEAERQVEVPYCLKSGDEQWAEVNASTILLDGRAVTLLTLVDVTARRLAEEQLAHTKTTRDNFLAKVSHELRTPLTSILGYTELLREDMKEANQSQYLADLDKVLAATHELVSLTKAIIDVTKIETGSLQLKLDTFLIEVLINEVKNETRSRFVSNNNSLQVIMPPDPGTITTDQEKVRQILINLLDNAAKFTHDGKVKLQVSREIEQAGDTLVFTIRDTGIGMTPEQINQLFEPFVQGDNSSTRRYSGAGLGMAISLGFCRMLHGELAVASESGKGSVVVLTIPAAA